MGEKYLNYEKNHPLKTLQFFIFINFQYIYIYIYTESLWFGSDTVTKQFDFQFQPKVYL